MRRFTLLIAALLVFTKCLPTLVPAEGTVRARRDGDYAIAEVSGVHLWASGNEWTGAPYDLTDVLTPIAVTIENRSGSRVRLTTRDFSLRGSTGFRYAALPPLSGQAPRGELRQAPSGMSFVEFHRVAPVRAAPYRNAPAPQRFWVARPHGSFYSGYPVWPYGWPWWDPTYQQRWYSSWPQTLPSEDMLQRALPDGVLEDGGRMSGFVYFQHLKRERSVELEFDLHDAETGASLGTLRVPFDVHR